MVSNGTSIFVYVYHDEIDEGKRLWTTKVILSYTTYFLFLFFTL